MECRNFGYFLNILLEVMGFGWCLLFTVLHLRNRCRLDAIESEAITQRKSAECNWKHEITTEHFEVNFACRLYMYMYIMCCKFPMKNFLIFKTHFMFITAFVLNFEMRLAFVQSFGLH